MKKNKIIVAFCRFIRKRLIAFWFIIPLIDVFLLKFSNKINGLCVADVLVFLYVPLDIKELTFNKTIELTFKSKF
jgi:hypothetical protein